jgi:molybdenum cofactor guanylyltransferase
MSINVAPLYGLVLAGGESRRMGQDKAALHYHGKSQLRSAFDLLSSVCEHTFISVRSSQCAEPTRAALPQIVDRAGIGPLAGIGAALEAKQDAAWLILACDLPFLSRAALTHLISRREPTRIATAYRSTLDGLPEPLSAIWEPASRDVVLSWLQDDKRCPRKLLTNYDAALIDQLDAHTLDNINTPAEYAAAQAALA